MSGLGYGLAFLGSFVSVALLTPLARRIALSRNITDNPDGPGGRKHQRMPIPYLGGLAMSAGMALVVMAGAFLVHPDQKDAALALSVMAPALMLALIGFLDDKSGLSVTPRLVSQIIAGVVTASLIFSSGTRAQLFGHWYLDAPITIFWVVGIVNAMNFMDNMDGLSASIGGIAALGFALVAAMNNQYLVAALSLALAGSCVGFLIYNWSPARIYMGDAGALFIGFLLAVLAVRLNLSNVDQQRSLLVPLALLVMPLADTTTVVISRLRRGVSPLTAGRDHLSHRISHTLAKHSSLQGIALTRATVGIMAAFSLLGLLAAVGLAQ